MIVAVPSPSAVASTIRACQTCFGFPATTYVRYGRMQHGGASALELDDENAVEIDMRGTRHVVFPVRGGRQDYRGCRYSRRPSMRSQTAFEKMTDKPGDRA